MTRKPINYLTVVILLFIVISCAKQKLKIDATFCENKQEILGVSTKDFRLSWNMKSPDRGVEQTAYRILLAENKTDLLKEKGLIWDSRKINSNQSILVVYSGPELLPGKTYYWMAKAWDNKGNESDWSCPARITTELSDAKDWNRADWIALDELNAADRIVPGIHVPMFNPEYKNRKSGEHILPLFRKEFMVRKNLKEALVFITGLGQYELRLNGEKVGDHFMAPGWTDYDSTVLYNIYDISEQVKPGINAFGVLLGNGFFNIPNTRYRKLITAFGNPKMILKLQLNYKDGTSETLVSNESWKVSPGPVTYSSIFGGETWNANMEQKGWDKPGFNDSSWKPARIVMTPDRNLRVETDYPVTVCDIINLKSIRKISSAKDSYLYDFGQNASGIIELEVKGNKGDTIHLYPAELIKETLEAEQKATGSPYYFTYILKGEGVEKWSPHFTYTGFRYVQVIGAVPDTLRTDTELPHILSMKFLHTRNSAPQNGSFTTSFDLFNRINELINWAVRSNLQSVVTDCPHREKLGWLEQTYLMGGAIHYNYNIYHLYDKLISDMREAQSHDGLIPSIVPEYTEFTGGFRDSPEWGSAAVVLPWMIYNYYGDIRPIEKAWPMMVRYMGYLKSKSDHNILSHGLGDWYDLGPELPGVAQLTPVEATATAIYYYDASLMSRMASLTGRDSEAKEYAGWAEEIRKAYNDKFLDPVSHIYSTGSQTAISMPLVLGIVQDSLKKDVFRSLVESVNKSGKALTAGDVGFHFLVRALEEGDAADLQFEMNARDDVPGYGYQLKKGATALTESWAALERVSNNHLMLGHLMEWFYSGLGGIDQSETSVAYKEILIAPQIINSIDDVSATFKSPYGTIVSKWSKTAEGTRVEVEIPVNTSALLVLPVEEGNEIMENGISIDNSDYIRIITRTERMATLNLGSGVYEFLYR